MDYDLSGVPAEETLDDAYSDTLDASGAEALEQAREIASAYRGMWAHEWAVYDAAADIAASLDTSPPAIEQFCEDADLSGDDGLFVSALINEDDGDRYALPDMDGVDHVGLRNESHVRIHGRTGDLAGEEMAGGHLHVAGDTGERTGAGMDGGTIRVDGGVGPYVGEGMEDGFITVRGDAGAFAGRDMAGGTIATYGDISLDRWRDGGAVYTVTDGELRDAQPGIVRRAANEMLRPVRQYLEREEGYVADAKKRVAAHVVEQGPGYRAAAFGASVWGVVPGAVFHTLTRGRGETVLDESVGNLIAEDRSSPAGASLGEAIGINATGTLPALGGFVGVMGVANGGLTSVEGAVLAGPALGFMAVGGSLDALDGAERVARTYLSDALLETDV